MKSMFASIVGRPNVGKSTLLNAIMNEKIAITSAKPQTTRNMIEGIYTKDDKQIVFVDTPGIHKPKDKLGSMLNEEAYYALRDVDAILFLVDGSQEFGKGDTYILERLKKTNKKIVLVINKIDKITKEKLLEKINSYKDLYDFDEVVPVSAYKKDNVKTLIKVLDKYLVDDVLYYDTNTKTTSPTRFIISELIREKVFNLTEEEIPYQTMCYLDLMEKKKDSCYISGIIVVNRENLKKIIIGKKGATIKKIGMAAREDIESYLKTRVYLDLRVKTVKNWEEKDEYLRLSNLKHE